MKASILGAILYPTLSQVLADFGEHPPCYRVEFKNPEDLRKSLPEVFGMVGQEPYEKFFAGMDQNSLWFSSQEMKPGSMSETFTFTGDDLSDSEQIPYKGPALESFTDLTDLMEWVIPIEDRKQAASVSV